MILSIKNCSINFMKVRFNGIVKTAELRQLIYQALREVEELGVEQMRGCHLYFTPVDAGGKSYEPRKHGKGISELQIDAPYRCAADELGL